MTCHKIGLPPISTIGFGLTDVSSLIRVPSPPANITAFIFAIALFSQPVNLILRRSINLTNLSNQQPKSTIQQEPSPETNFTIDNTISSLGKTLIPPSMRRHPDDLDNLWGDQQYSRLVIVSTLFTSSSTAAREKPSAAGSAYQDASYQMQALRVGVAWIFPSKIIKIII